MWDVNGREYLDFSSGIAVNALGHGDAGVVEVSLLIIMIFSETELRRLAMPGFHERGCF